MIRFYFRLISLFPSLPTQAFGVRKLQIVCVVEDDQVSIGELSEKIKAFENCVQSVDVVAFNQI